MINETFSEEFRTEFWKYRKVANEVDLTPVHLTRAVCKEAGLLKLHRGTFAITQLGEKLLAPANAGKLFARLFEAHCCKINLAYFDGYPIAPGIQTGLPYTLYRLGAVARKWITIEQVATEAVLPSAREEYFQTSGYDDQEFASSILITRILNPLIEWGLLDAQQDDAFMGIRLNVTAVRTTPLFDKAIRITLP